MINDRENGGIAFEVGKVSDKVYGNVETGSLRNGQWL